MSSTTSHGKSKRAVVVLHLELSGADGLSTSENDGQKFDVLWKRGSKKENSGKSDRAQCKDGVIPAFGAVTLHLKLQPTSGSSSTLTDPTKLYCSLSLTYFCSSFLSS